MPNQRQEEAQRQNNGAKQEQCGTSSNAGQRQREDQKQAQNGQRQEEKRGGNQR